MNLNVDLDQVQERTEEQVRKGKAGATMGELPYTSRAKKVLEFAVAEARDLNHSYVGTEHLLLGLLREEKGVAAQVLESLGVTLEQGREQTLKLLGTDMPASGEAAASPSTPKEKKSKTPALDHLAGGGLRAGSDDRPRERDRAGDGDPLATQEEQPGADR